MLSALVDFGQSTDIVGCLRFDQVFIGLQPAMYTIVHCQFWPFPKPQICKESPNVIEKSKYEIVENGDGANLSCPHIS